MPNHQRLLKMKMSMSLDGFVGGPQGELDWMFRSDDDAATKWIVDVIEDVGAHLMGRKTFHDMSAYWPTSTEPFARTMNNIPKVVFSKEGFDPKQAGPTTASIESANAVRTAPLAKAAQIESWHNARVITGDLAAGIKKLKSEPGKPLLAHGGASFCQSLIAADLLDELYLMIHPVAIGKGLPLFSRVSKDYDLKLVRSTNTPSGVIACQYLPASRL